MLPPPEFEDEYINHLEETRRQWTMSNVKIETLGVTVRGRVTRSFDGVDTTLVINEEQARQLHGALGSVVQFFEQQGVGE